MVRGDWQLEERYPPWYKAREEYCDKVGDLREDMLEQIFSEMKFKVRRKKSRGIDLRLYLNGQLVALIEASNEWVFSYYDKRRQEYTVQLFNKWHHRKAIKLWVCSFAGSLDSELLKASDIQIVPLGYQTLQVRDYEWFMEKDQHYFREPTTTAYEKTKTVLETLTQKLIKPN
jgi:hypothetical protein